MNTHALTHFFFEEIAVEPIGRANSANNQQPVAKVLETPYRIVA